MTSQLSHTGPQLAQTSLLTPALKQEIDMYARQAVNNAAQELLNAKLKEYGQAVFSNLIVYKSKNGTATRDNPVRFYEAFEKAKIITFNWEKRKLFINDKVELISQYIIKQHGHVKNDPNVVMSVCFRYVAFAKSEDFDK